MLDNTQIAFIGAGNMASSLIGGLITRGTAEQQIRACDPWPEALSRLSQQYPGVSTASEAIDIIDAADVIVLAVKPQVLREVSLALAPALQGNSPLIISIAAGINLNSLQNWLGKHLPIVRCMPNTPALVQQGATGLFANAQVSDTQKALTKQILDAVGLALWLNSEADIDAVTALSGSGPAYYFLLMEAMTNAGIALGLDAQTARELTLQTARGAAEMACTSDSDAATLRNNVTSPGGTTEQAILYFQQQQFEDIVNGALTAARDRSISLSDELGKD